MSESSKPNIPFTVTDIDVGVRLVEALVQHVRANGPVPISYADVLERGRILYPHDAVLGRAVPVGIRPKLAFVSAFCRAGGFPDLSSLVAKEVSGRESVADTSVISSADWSAAMAKLDAFATQARAALPRNLKPRKERPAEVAWYAYFCSHREACAKVTSEDKKEIVNMLMSGLDPDTALRRFLAAKAEYANAS
ncbi:MAG TPA: hypothetical protein DDX04_05125 [Massilia sp.]|nr:hypothetical protein [Massilia sp.]